MKKYCAFFKIQILKNIQYRAPMFFAILALVIWGGMKVFLFNAFYEGTMHANVVMNSGAVRAYVWLEGIFLPLFGMWMLEDDIAKSAMNGDIGYDLIKPASLYWMWFSKCLASRVSKTLIRFGPVLLVAVCLPEPYNLPAPSSYLLFVAFLISSVLATLLLVAMSMFVYIMTCRMLAFSGIKSIVVTITTFFTGGVIPLPFFPDAIINWLTYAPFTYVQNVAFRIYSGNISGMNVLYSIGGQFVWMLIMITVGKWYASRTFRSIIIQGG